jgi:hypothetical protein
VTAGVRAGLPSTEHAGRAGDDRAAPGMAAVRPAPRTEAAARIRRVANLLLVLVVLGGAAATVGLASSWTASVARFPDPQPGVAQLESELATEQGRADDLQAQLDSIIAASANLAAGMDDVGARLGGDTTSAQSLRTALAAARARLTVLQQALANAGVALPTRVPATDGGTPGGAGAAAGAGAILPAITPAPTTAPPAAAATYPPGVPASWPSGKPIPPMPSPCVQPQLEDNGVWNCQH